MDKNLKKIMAYAKPYKGYVAGNIISNILYAFFGMLTMLVLMPMLQILFKVTDGQIPPKPQWTGWTHAKAYLEQWTAWKWADFTASHTVAQSLGMVIAMVLVVVFLKNLFGYLALVFGTILRNGILRDIRIDIYRKILRLPLSYFSDMRKGDVMARMTADVTEVQNTTMTVLEMIVRDPMTILFTVGAMWFLNPQLTLFIFFSVPVGGLIISLIGKKLKQSSLKVQKTHSRFMSLTEETLSGIKIIKGFNAEPLFKNKFRRVADELFRLSNRMLNRQNLASPLSEFLGVGIIAVIIAYGGHLVLVEKSLSAPVFITFIALAYNVLTPAKNIAKAGYAVRRGMASAQRVFEIMEADETIKDIPGAVEKKNFEKEIVLDDVYFRYEMDDVLRGVSFRVPKGSTVALVGQSGSGKTTVAHLLMRFYDVTGGRILLDGIDIRDIRKRDLRNLMAIVTQESILFNDTVRNNIALAKPDATDEEIIRAAKVANAHDFIMQLPQGYDTNIGDSGNKLSGGQKQRINIARAVLKNPPIMILDEATSALDTESERLVQDALDKLMENHTSVVIAHRLSTIKNAGLIVVMDKGKVKEAGTHAQLMKQKGIYHKLVMLQSFDADPES
ncbi:MAG: ABC transporter ATP-binding protein [Chlorobi bacterium]|nr:ABC transporter ATP-binding protein [Chlorobiota bacterium]